VGTDVGVEADAGVRVETGVAVAHAVNSKRVKSVNSFFIMGLYALIIHKGTVTMTMPL
jgi:hypothetical protein